ncbi:hypothetical protein EI94DRAFT_1837385 [Lactarius quietus]|nr:hypothetical protein EI94DRAFT_1837385 [Lactarius quietus]
MEPAIDSIIQSWNKDKWKKLDQLHEIAQLHERFWCQGAYKDELLNTPEDEDSEIGPGCFVLDIGIPDLKPTEVWVRKEYIRINKYCHDYLEANRNQNMAPAVVVTGQPGIAEGVYATDSNYSCIGYKTWIWTLVDVEWGETLNHVGRRGTKNMIIFATFPNKDQWDGLDKTSAMTIAIMNPWTREEISEVAPLHGFQANDQRLDEMYNQFGPTARICFDYPQRPLLVTEHLERYSMSLRSISSRLLQEMVHGICSPKAYKMSNTMILLKRLPRKEYHHKTLEPATPTIEMDLREQLRRETHAQ